MEANVRTQEFKKFYEALMSKAPEGYIPWLFPLKKNGKDPDSFAIASRAPNEAKQNEKTSWKENHARLTYQEAINRIEQGFNVGIAARKEDPLHITDNDSEIHSIEFKGLMVRSRTRFGRHFFNWMKPQEKRNIPTSTYGEVRSSDQYVVCAGSYVPVSEKDLQKKFEEGSITLERIKEIIEDKKIGVYTYEFGTPEEITTEELPKIFLDQLRKDEESLNKKIIQEEKKKVFDKNEKKNDQTELFEINLSTVCPVSIRGRTSHPLHDSDTGSNFAVTGEIAHCWRHGVSLNAYQYLAVECGAAECQEAGTRHKEGGCGISGKIDVLYQVWKYAKQKGYLKENDKVPYKCLVYLLNKKEGSKLSATEYNEAISIVNREVPSGRNKIELSEQLGEFFDWKKVTEQFVEDYPHYYDNSGIWWKWNEEKKKWSMVDETDILIMVDEAVKNKPTLQSSIKSQIVEGLRRAARRNKPQELPETCVQFKDRIINVATGEEFEATPEYFNKNPIPWEIGTTEETPEIDKLFTDWVDEKKDLLYEIIAFSTIPSYFLHRAFALTGSGSNGKSKFLGIVRTFIGPENYCDTELDDISNNRFESSKMYSKLVAFMGETDFKAVEKTSRFKKLTGQDPVSYEFKNKNPFTGVNYAKILVSTNNLPMTMDKTYGFYRRWVVISFDKTFNEAKDVLQGIPPHEYNNLARKCLRLVRELWINRKFSKEGSVEDRKKAYEEKSNPLGRFIKEECTLDPNEFTFKWELRDAFKIYCKNNGYREWNEREVGQYMSNEGFETKQRSKDGNTWWSYSGISLRKRVSVEKSIPSQQDKQDKHLNQLGDTYTRGTKWEEGVYPVYPVNFRNHLEVDKIEMLEFFLFKHPLNNEEILENKFGKDQIQLWIAKGDLFQSRPGTLKKT